MTDDLLSILNPQQRQAVSAGEGPVLVLAGPGSGKTRVLTHRIAWLVREQGIPPHQLLAVTFTNKAAAEMRHRVETTLDGKLDGAQIGTFHAICARLLRIEADHLPYGRDYAIYDTDDQMTLIKAIMVGLNVDMKRFKPGAVLHAISAAKSELILPDDMPRGDYPAEIAARVYPLYQKALIDAGAMDFDDLLMQTALLLRDNDGVREKYQRRFYTVMVDEFQDTNTAQYALVKLLGAPRRNIFAVGDEDQGIYAFRGADYRNVSAFKRDYPDSQVILLEQNYRSTQNVLDVARAVIDRNPNRTKKKLFTERGEGGKVAVQEIYSEAEEGQFVGETIRSMMRQHGYTFRDFAVMYRTNAQSRALEDACAKYNLPYKLIGGVGFYKRREVRDLIAYLRVINNPNESVSFERVVNTPARGIGDKTVAGFKMWAADQGWSLARALGEVAGGTITPFGGRAAKALAAFAKQLALWQEIAANEPLDVLFDVIMNETHYAAYLRDLAETPEELEERMGNVAALRGYVSDKKDLALRDYLEETALASEIDTLDPDKNGVTLLTLHAAKGLEYPVVFITGIEEGLLPHSRSIAEPEAMQEERRLFYVGVTRAKDRLFLTYAFRRSLYGDSQLAEPSRFLADIPANLTEGNWYRLNTKRDRAAIEYATTWDREPREPDAPSAPETPLPPREARPSREPSQPNNVISFEKASQKLDLQSIRDKYFPPSGSSGGVVPRQGMPPRSTPSLKYAVGLRVFHPKFGEGVVLSSTRSGDDEEVEIQFEAMGRRVVSAAFANLVILGK
ncbi:MAG: UvrD-helicase domain-containing protein [Chloroflexota bacterium]|nr:UvrD-helicase domain-containing protein [Chloroflexota bacterium]